MVRKRTWAELKVEQGKQKVELARMIMAAPKATQQLAFGYYALCFLLILIGFLGTISAAGTVINTEDINLKCGLYDDDVSKGICKIWYALDALIDFEDAAGNRTVIIAGFNFFLEPSTFQFHDASNMAGWVMTLAVIMIVGGFLLVPGFVWDGFRLFLTCALMNHLQAGHIFGYNVKIPVWDLIHALLVRMYTLFLGDNWNHDEMAIFSVVLTIMMLYMFERLTIAKQYGFVGNYVYGYEKRRDDLEKFVKGKAQEIQILKGSGRQ